MSESAFAAAIRPTPRPWPTAAQAQLAELLTRRRQLQEAWVAERNRLGTSLSLCGGGGVRPLCGESLDTTGNRQAGTTCTSSQGGFDCGPWSDPSLQAYASNLANRPPGEAFGE